MESEPDPRHAKRTRVQDDKPSKKRKTLAKPNQLKDCRTTVSLSLRKCLASVGTKANSDIVAIERMVAAVTWASQRTMWFANLVVLKCLEGERDPPPLTRKFLYQCFQYSCQANVSAARAARPHDYRPREMLKTQQVKANKFRKEQGLPPLKSPQDDETISKQVLDPDEVEVSNARAVNIMRQIADEFRLVEQCTADFEAVRAEGHFDDGDLWRPESAQPHMTKATKTQTSRPLVGTFCVPGLGTHMEAMIESEMLDNCCTYIQTTFVARRRLYLEDAIARHFPTPAHRSRVVTLLQSYLNDVSGTPLRPDTVIDWTPVISRIRTAALVASFETELSTALDGGLIGDCARLLAQLGQTLPATTDNLKTHPHLFLRQMHTIQVARDTVLLDLQEVMSKQAGDAEVEDCTLEGEIEQLAARLDYQDRIQYRKVFALLPNRGGQSAFIFIDKNRAAAMKTLQTDSVGRWYDNIFNLSPALGRGKMSKVLPTSFRTDGVQLKVGLKRPGSTSDLMVKRGFGSLRDRRCESIECERRGIFELNETVAQDTVVLQERGLVGLDPGRKDVYSSVMNLTEHANRGHHLSNEQWAQLQRTRMIRQKDRKWRRVSKIARLQSGGQSVLDGLSMASLRTGTFVSMARSVHYRLLNAQIISDYQTRRNRNVFRFSRLLATQSATARVCNAIMHHSSVLPRVPSTTRRKSRRIGNRFNPIVVFGGGQYASGGNGLASVPRKALIRELGHKTVVVIADEYKTSQVCCKCGTKLTDPDLRPFRRGIRIGEKRVFAPRDSRRLRQCQSEACCISESSDDDVTKKYAMHWNRDTNAAINILQVGVEWWLRGVRPEPLRRSTPTTPASVDSLLPEGILEDINLLSEQQ